MVHNKAPLAPPAASAITTTKVAMRSYARNVHNVIEGIIKNNNTMAILLIHPNTSGLYKLSESGLFACNRSILVLTS